MVRRHSRPVTVRQANNTLSIAFHDMGASFTLDPINRPCANYISPIISYLLFSIIWSAAVAVVVWVTKTVTYSISLFIPVISWIPAALLTALLYSALFKQHYTFEYYFSVSMHQFTYIWPLLFTDSLFTTFFPSGSAIMYFVHLTIFIALSQFFIRAQFKDALFKSSKYMLVFSIVSNVACLIFGGVLFTTSLLFPLFKAF